jgi:DNA replication and repair protein RecF
VYIETLDLTAFRNSSSQKYAFHPGVTVIVGPNASGKTVLLEAIAFLSRGKSPRASQDKAMLQWEKTEGKVMLRTRSQAGVFQHVEARFHVLEQTGSCRVAFRLNDKPVKSRSEIVGRVPTVTFFANDLLLLRGAPDDRRQFLDGALMQYDPSTCQLLKRYQQVKTQKAALLKQAQMGHSVEDMLTVLNQQLVEVGSAVIYQRLQYLLALSPGLQEAYANLSDQHDPLDVFYVSSLCHPNSGEDKAGSLSLNVSLEEIQSRYHEAIRQVALDERRRGVVLVGPHRDDLLFTLYQQNACEYASQGQQRSIVLAFKTAELALLKAHLAQETPILLLDDVMAELDTQRQAALLALFEADLQVLMTTTHLDNTLSLLGDVAYHVITVTSPQAPALTGEEPLLHDIGVSAAESLEDTALVSSFSVA